MVGIPNPLLLHALQIIARILDVAVPRLQRTTVRLDPIPHMCGWLLIRRWTLAAGAFQHLPPRVDGFRQLAIAQRDLILDVLEASIDAWNTHGASVDFRSWCADLRRFFFAAFATAPAFAARTPVALHVHFVALNQQPPVAPAPRFPAPDIPDAAIINRLQLLARDSGWLATDELDFLLTPLRLYLNQVLFAPPSRWFDDRNDLVYYDSTRVDFRPYSHVVWFALYEEAWIQFQLIDQGVHYALFCTCHPDVAQCITRFAVFIANNLGIHVSRIQVVHITSHAPHGLCGWMLLFELFQRVNTAIPNPSEAQHELLQHSRHHAHIARVIYESRNEWQRIATTQILDFCTAARTAFLCQILRGSFGQPVSSGGGVSSSTSGNPPVDPLFENDPWKQPKTLFGSWWEDLLLPTDHPLKEAGGTQLEQTHRWQASARRHGAVLATKTALPELSRIAPAGDFVIVLPQLDRAKLGDFGPKLKGPRELILHDPLLKTDYKRLVMLYPIKGDIIIKLPDAKATFTAAEVVELVLELDARLLTAADSERVRANPFAALRQAASEQFMDLKDNMQFYAFRSGRHPTASSSEAQFQCIVKLPTKNRSELLQGSGASQLLVRDFVENGQQSTDLTVIPRFWEVSPQHLHEALIMTQKVTGFAGVVITRRGLAVRSWTNNVAYIHEESSDPLRQQDHN